MPKREEEVTNPMDNIRQSDAVSVLAELETGYRALRSAAADIMDGKAGAGYDQPLLPRLHQAMDMVQEVQRDIMLVSAMALRSSDSGMENS